MHLKIDNAPFGTISYKMTMLSTKILPWHKIIFYKPYAVAEIYVCILYAFLVTILKSELKHILSYLTQLV